MKKGSTVLSESFLSISSIIISLILIVLVVQITLSQQKSEIYSETFSSVARDITIAIDRAAALAGSGMIEQKIPEGLKMNLTVGYKSVFITYDGDTLKKSFSGLLHSGPYEFINPQTLCIVKSRNDRRVNIVDKPCACNPKDNVCDPECIVNSLCDYKCYTEQKDNVCNSFCVKNNDGICDPDCYTNEQDTIWDRDCINPERDGICDPDSDGIQDGICDQDCFEKYNGVIGVCDPECRPKDTNNDGLEDTSDDICYAGCYNYTDINEGLVLKLDGICDLDCNQTNNICDPDCKKDEDCMFKCAMKDESCVDIPCCPETKSVCCPGSKICSLTCCGNDVCETKKMWGPDNETNWENFYTCENDCEHREDDVCSKVLNVIAGENLGCDPDCLEKYRESREKNNYCDPECSWHRFQNNQDICQYHDTNLQTKNDGVCMEIEDNACDSDCSTNSQKCDPDCCPFNSVANCPSSPGCYCPVRMDRKSFSSSPYFTNTQDANCHDHEPHWTNNVIEICSPEAIEFLDRRGWEINQVVESIKALSPEGWVFDGSRYVSILTEGIQKASKTLNANENYHKSTSSCCCKANECSITTDYIGDECCGVGFCGDHATALLSVLRTLGVPAKDVFATFTSDFSGVKKIRHAFVVYKCDPSLPYRLKLKECEGNWDKWLIIDATSHSIRPLEGGNECSHMCIWYNDYGAYQTIDPNIHGFGGKISSTQGYPFPNDIGCKVDECCVHEKLCPLTGINCV